MASQAVIFNLSHEEIQLIHAFRQCPQGERNVILQLVSNLNPNQNPNQEDVNLQISIQHSIQDIINEESKQQEQSDLSIALELQQQELELTHETDNDEKMAAELQNMELNAVPSHHIPQQINRRHYIPPQINRRHNQQINRRHNQQINRRHSEPINNANNNNTCTICLMEYSNSDSKKTLPCMHVFHSDCINPWIARHTTCPICRTNINIAQ